MKTYRWIFVPIILIGLVALSWKTQQQVEDAPIHANKIKAIGRSPRTTGIKNQSIEEIVEGINLANKQRLSKEAVRIVEDVRKIIKEDDMLKLNNALDEILYRYKGDPNPLILELADLLTHENIFVRLRMVEVFLSTGLETEMAKQILLSLVRADSPIMYAIKKNDEIDGMEDQLPPADMRIGGANLIAIYGIKEASDDVWNLYQQTKSKELIEPLRRLNDPRIIEELRADAVKNLGTIENMKLIGEYRFAEALPELKRRYEDKNSNADVRFRTLYPLWRITGEEKYFDEFAASFLPSSIPLPYLVIGGEREHQYLIDLLDTAGSNTLDNAAIALLVRFNDRETLKKMLIGYFHDVRNSNWKSGVLARRLVGSIDDLELTRVAEEYETKYTTGIHDRYVVYRKKWSYARDAVVLFMD